MQSSDSDTINFKALVRAPLFPSLLSTGTLLVALFIFGEFFRKFVPAEVYQDVATNIVLAAFAGFFAFYAFGLVAVAVIVVLIVPALEKLFPTLRSKRKRILSGSTGVYFILTVLLVVFLGVIGGTIPFALMCLSEYGTRIKLSRDEIPDWAIEKARRIIEGKDT